MNGDKTTTQRWLDCLFGHVTRSEQAAKKTSCGEIFSLALTREEVEYLHAVFHSWEGLYLSTTGKKILELWKNLK